MEKECTIFGVVKLAFRNLLFIILLELCCFVLYYILLNTKFYMFGAACIVCMTLRVFIQIYYLIKTLIIELYMKINHIDIKQDIIWWNGRNCVLLSDMVLIYNFKMLSFKYDEIKSVQTLYKTNRGYVTYYLDFNLSNDIKYKVFMYSNGRLDFKYRKITDISEIVKERNPSIVIKEKRRFDSFRDS